MANENVISYFNQYLGRNPTSGELSFLNKFMDNGELSLGEVGQLVQGLPESRQRILDQQTPLLENRLAAGERASLDATMSRAVPQINARLAGLGRQNSSAFEGALSQQLGQEGGRLAARRQDALAQFYGSGLSNISNQYAEMSSGAQGRGYQVRDIRQQQDFDKEMSQRGYELYQQYLKRQGAGANRKAIGQLGGLAAGAAIGYFGGGTAATTGLGAGLGSSVGGNVGGLF